MNRVAMCMTLGAGLLLTGCSATRQIRGDFYSSAPAAGEAKLPLKAAVLSTAADKAAAVTHYSAGADCAGQLTVRLQPGLANAVQAAMSDAFQKTGAVRSAKEASGADFLVTYALGVSEASDEEGGDELSVSLLDATGATVRRYAKPVLPDVSDVSHFGVCILGVLPPMYFLFPVAASLDASSWSAMIEKRCADALKEIAAEIRQDKELLDYPRRSAECQRAEAAGDRWLERGDAAKAFGEYRRALSLVLAGPRQEQLEEKAASAAARLGALPPVPEQARDLMARGKAFVASAKSSDDYSSASESMEKALAVAPWWPVGQFNAALAAEAAGQWASAAHHLKLYQALSPGASDREKVRQKIAELEIKQEKGESSEDASETTSERGKRVTSRGGGDYGDVLDASSTQLPSK